MTPSLSQAELASYVANGDTTLIQYRRAFNILHSPGVREYILSPIPGMATGLPYTKRGRFQCVTPALFRQIQLHS